VCIGVFARAPVPGRAKTRLIRRLGARRAAELQAALILDTTRKVNKLARQAARWFFLAGSAYPAFPRRSEWTLARQRGCDLGQRMDRAFCQMLRRHRAAVIIGTDSPLLSPRLLRQALSELQVCEAVLGPCPDGGFYLIGLRRTSPALFHGVRWSTRWAFRDMLRRLLRQGLSCAILEGLTDLDRPQDLADLASGMARRPALRASAPALWRFLKWKENRWK